MAIVTGGPGTLGLRPRCHAPQRKEFVLFNPNLMSAWFEAVRFAVDSQRVIALRILRMAGGGPLAATEFARMITEKITAFSEAQGAIATALMTGGNFRTAAGKAYAPYRRKVRANNRRLGS